MTEEAKRRLAAILARDPIFGNCRCDECVSTIIWASELAHLRFYAHTCGEPEDRAEALDGFWALITGPFGPKDWPKE
jgi:hypothetical protein